MKILLSWIKLENKLSFLQALKIETLSEELQDYKRGRITKVFLRETSLHKEPVYFNCYPNFALSLSDRNIMDALTLKC